MFINITNMFIKLYIYIYIYIKKSWNYYYIDRNIMQTIDNINIILWSIMNNRRPNQHNNDFWKIVTLKKIN